MLQKTRWINTYLEYDSAGRLVRREGYWYAGPVTEAGGATTSAQDWAFYLDDGTDDTDATIINAKNTNPSKGDLVNDTVYQYRQGIEEDGGGGFMNATIQLQYNHNSAGFVNVTGSSSVIRSAASTKITDGADTSTLRITTQVLHDTTNEGQDDVDGIAGGPSADLSNSGFECLWGFQIIGADVSDGDTIVLKIVNSLAADADFTNYEQTDPTITVEADASVTVPLTTVLATAAVGTVEPETAVALTGESATGAVGTVTPEISYSRDLTGVEGTAAVGSVSQSRTVALTGVGGTSAVGTVGNETSVALTSADGGSGTLDLQVGASGDDVFLREQLTTIFNATASLSRVGNFNATNYDYVIPARFLNVTVPPGATIDVCNVVFTPPNTQSVMTLDIKYQFEDADDAAQLADYPDYASRSLTTANVTEASIGTWTEDVEETSPDLSSVLQEVIDREGWASGNAVSLYVRPTAASEGAYRDTYSYDGDPDKALKLHIEFSAATTASVGSVSPANTQDITGNEGIAAVGTLTVEGAIITGPLPGSLALMGIGR